MVVLASWEKEECHVKLNIDWKKLGIEKSKAILEIPGIYRVQGEGIYKPGDSLKVPPTRGLFLTFESIGNKNVEK